MSEALALIELQAENILRLKAVTIHLPRSGALIIEGKNEQGKSSVLRLADLLLAGARKGEDPIHENEEEGWISGKLGPYTITRRFKRGGNPSLTIKEEGKKGKRKAPQTLLAEFVDFLSVDPTKFLRMEPDEQLAVISRIVGFDPAQYDGKRKEAYEKRTLVNRDRDRIEGELAGVAHHDDVPSEPVRVSALAVELATRQEHNRTGIDLEVRVADARKALRQKHALIEEQERTLIRLREEEVSLDAHAKEFTRTLARFEPADEDEILEQMKSTEATNQKVRDNQRRARLLAEHAEFNATSDKLTETIKEIDAKKAAARKKAAEKLAIPGLDITASGILYNEKPFAQSGQSAEIRIASAISMAAADDKPVKLLTIDEAQALDPERLEQLVVQANEAGFQVMIARNGTGDEPGTITIEDGRRASDTDSADKDGG